MPTWLTAIFQVLANVTGLAKARSDRKNAPDVRDRAKAQQEANSVAKSEGAVAAGAVDELRKELAE